MYSAVDEAYHERNRLVAALARLFPSGVRKTAIEGWDPEWHNCVFIDLPTGQASWHYHDREAHLFDGLPEYTQPWDGHSTPEKYRRLDELGRAWEIDSGGTAREKHVWRPVPNDAMAPEPGPRIWKCTQCRQVTAGRGKLPPLKWGCVPVLGGPDPANVLAPGDVPEPDFADIAPARRPR